MSNKGSKLPPAFEPRLDCAYGLVLLVEEMGVEKSISGSPRPKRSSEAD